MFKDCMNKWLVSRGSSQEKRGTKELEFSCSDVHIRSILSLIPESQRASLKVKRQLTAYKWILSEDIVQNPFFSNIFEIPTKALPKSLPNLSRVYLDMPMILYVCRKKGLVVSFQSMTGLDGFGDIQWTTPKRNRRKTDAR
eukprot:298163-Hanusia_phi.AAC.1